MLNHMITEIQTKKKCHFHSESLLGHRGRNCEINKSPPYSESHSYMKHNYLMFFSSSCFFFFFFHFQCHFPRQSVRSRNSLSAQAITAKTRVQRKESGMELKDRCCQSALMNILLVFYPLELFHEKKSIIQHMLSWQQVWLVDHIM